MPNANYLKGAGFERDFIALNDREHIGLRTAGSHSCFDVVLIQRGLGNVIFCQLKRYKKGSPKPKIPKELKKIAEDNDIVVWFVTKEDYKPLEIQIV
ncbi:MAG: hypothetical protein ACOC5T_09470 [Elusimicrobiota bacterium]